VIVVAAASEEVGTVARERDLCVSFDGGMKLIGKRQNANVGNDAVVASSSSSSCERRRIRARCCCCGCCCCCASSSVERSTRDDDEEEEGWGEWENNPVLTTEPTRDLKIQKQQLLIRVVA